MTSITGAKVQSPAAAAGGFTPLTVIRTIAFAVVIWFCVAQMIRLGGASQFNGPSGALTYGATVLVTVPLNWLTRVAAGMPARAMPLVAALTLATTTTLEGFAMKLYPAIYGSDPGVIGAGAIWLLFAVGLGLAASFVTAALAARRA